MNHFLNHRLKTLNFGLILFVLLFAKTGSASFETPGAGARSIALGGAFTGLVDNSDAIFINPAGIAQIISPDISVFYARPYGMRELAYSSIGAVYPKSIVSIGAAAQTQGHDLYRESVYILSLARGSSGKVYYGLNVRYMTLQIKNYGSAGSASVDAGVLAKPLQHLSFGASIQNLSRSSIGQENERVPQIYRAGLHYSPLSQISITLDAYKDVSFPLEAHYGIEYHLIEQVDLRFGASNNPSRFGAGFGLFLKGIRVDYAVTTHQDLGLTHQFSLSFSKNGLRKFDEPTQRGEESQPIKRPKKVRSKKKVLKKLKAGTGETININTADIELLQRLPYVGKKTAAEIIKYRQEKGDFADPMELEKVPGIGVKTFEKIKPFIRLKD